MFGLQSFFWSFYVLLSGCFSFIYLNYGIIAILKNTRFELVAQPQEWLSPFVGLLSSQINNRSNLLTEVNSVFPSKWVLSMSVGVETLKKRVIWNKYLNGKI